jgi:hypothetical protein
MASTNGTLDVSLFRVVVFGGTGAQSRPLVERELSNYIYDLLLTN